MARNRKVEFVFDPFELVGKAPPEKRGERRRMLREIADEVLVDTLAYVDALNSPVSGHGRFRKLNKKYAKWKRKQGADPVPDLTLHREMLPALKATVKGDKIRLGIGPSKQGSKADGHCNFSGLSRLPLRRFIPNEKDGETFKRPILNDIKRIIKENG